METELRVIDSLYERDLGRVNAPHFAGQVLAEAIYGAPFPQPHFQMHLVDFLARNYNAPEHLLLRSSLP